MAFWAGGKVAKIGTPENPPIPDTPKPPPLVNSEIEDKGGVFGSGQD